MILAGLAFGALKYLLPHADSGNPLLNGLADRGPFLAPIIGILLLGVAGVSAVNAWGRRRLLDRQRDTDTLRQLHWQDFELLVGKAYRHKRYTVVMAEEERLVQIVYERLACLVTSRYPYHTMRYGSPMYYLAL